MTGNRSGFAFIRAVYELILTIYQIPAHEASGRSGFRMKAPDTAQHY
jgi:hypothetical protein